jgi:hypothetical protein
MPITEIRMPAAGMNGTFFTCPDCFSTECRFVRAVSCQDDWHVEEMFVAEFACTECGIHIRLRFVTTEGAMSVQETTSRCPADGCPYGPPTSLLPSDEADEREINHMKKLATCLLCRHRSRLLIDKGLAAGKAVDTIVRIFGIRRSVVVRHVRDHIPPSAFRDVKPTREGKGCLEDAC